MFSTLQSLSRRLVVGAAAASLLHERVSGLSTSAAAASVKAPVAARVPKAIKFGKVPGEDRGPNPMDPPIERDDPYFWLRDDTRKDQKILSLLDEENAYSKGATAHLEEFRESLYAEMLSHVQEDDDTVPYKDGDFFYWSRTVKDLSYRQYLRRPAAGPADAGEIYLDVNEVAKTLPNPKQCDVSQVELSPDGSKCAFAVDGTGYETYDVVVRTLDGSKPDETIKKTMGGVAWQNEDAFYYVVEDAAHRPYQVWRHVLGTSQTDDALIFEEPDDLFNVGCWRSLDGSLIFIEAESKETTELRVVPTATGEVKMVRPREYGVRYDAASHAPSNSLVLTSNVGGRRNRALFTAPLDDLANWSPVRDAAGADVLAHDDGRSLDAPKAFKDYLVVTGREDGFTQIWTVPLAAGDATCGAPAAAAPAHRLEFEAEAFTARLAANSEFDPKGVLRVTYGSTVSPSSTLAYTLATKSYETLKVAPVPNYDASLYATERIEVTARDGVKVPVTLLWRKDCKKEGVPMPTHLYGYGSYGICMDPSFAASRLALVDRGMLYAIAHVRGGGEMGHNEWYEQQGKYLAKKNTFHDFVDCAKHLKDAGLSSQMSCEGRSAGGLLVGNAVNLAPDSFVACIAGVPFVDLMTTMCDPSIPLTTEEWEEWGNPNEAKYHQYMLEYSPIDNISPVTYPKMLLVSGLNDPRVAYWEPAKWAQVLRHTVANPDDVYVKMDMSAGHFSAADRYRYLRELAFDFAWLLDVFGKAK